MLKVVCWGRLSWRLEWGVFWVPGIRYVWRDFRDQNDRYADYEKSGKYQNIFTESWIEEWRTRNIIDPDFFKSISHGTDFCRENKWRITRLKTTLTALFPNAKTASGTTFRWSSEFLIANGTVFSHAIHCLLDNSGETGENLDKRICPSWDIRWARI
jgi:hypothetical protein